MNQVVAGALVEHAKAETLVTRKTLDGFSSISELRSMMEVTPWVLKGDLEDFRRGSASVKLGQLCALLAASELTEWSPDETALIGWNGSGCSENNTAYWEDYAINGRELGRSGLFVATLPTTPACEVAITLGIHGPVFYLQTPASTEALFEEVDSVFLRGNIRHVIVLEINSDSACALFLERDDFEIKTRIQTETLSQLFFLLKERGKP